MNCPSRNDDVLSHPGWNQSPPRFAADLTTCQDLNGIANARELGHAGRLNGCSNSLVRCELEDSAVRESENTWPETGKGAKCPQQGHSTRSNACNTISREYHNGRALINYKPLASSTWRGWLLWLVSVFVTAIMISSASDVSVSGTISWVGAWFHSANGVWLPRSLPRFAKRDSCATGGASSDYDLPFHVGGLFIILFVSSTACAFPILVIKFPRLRIPASFLFSAKHFGTGVLIATAFVHLLPTAFLSLSNTCLSNFWTSDYPAMPGAIMLASIFFVTVIEMIFSPNQHVCGGNQQGTANVSRLSRHHAATQTLPPPIQPETRRAFSGDLSAQARDLGPLQGRATSISRTLTRMREENEILDSIEFGTSEVQHHTHEKSKSAVEDSERNHEGFGWTPQQEHKKAVMQCFLLEMGILFHSIFIGMSLSVSVGSEFVILLIAIIFHQTFEGLALGVRIATIEWRKGALQPWFMAFAYGCTTPLGQAIGIATHSLYSPDSEVGLLVVGIMNAISAGFLVFASLVELMSEDFLSDESWQVLRGKRRIYACALVFAGAFLMSLVGAWA